MSNLYFDQPRMHYGSKLWKKKESVHLEQVRDILADLKKRMEPLDRVVPSAALHLDFGVLADHLTVSTKGTNRNGILGVSKSGYSDLCKRAGLPGHMGSNLMHIASIPEREGAPVDGRHLASMAAGLMLRDCKKDVHVRTVKHLETGERYIRSAHSETYGILNHLQCVELLLESEAADWPVIDFLVTEQSFRCRQLVLEDGKTVGDIKLNEYIPSVQTENSETGKRSFWFKSGGWKPDCMNGMFSWNPQCSIQARHKGDFDRIVGKIQGGMEAVMAHAQGFFEAYDVALETSIADAYKWFEQTANASNVKYTKAEKEGVARAMHDPTSGNFGLLTNVFDAVTLAAQESIDEFRQEQLEGFGGRLLRVGLSQARDGQIPVLLEA